MSFYQLSIPRFFTVYIAQGAMFFYFFFNHKILKRDTKRLNVIFTGFYLGNVIGFFVNFIYAPVTDADIFLIMHGITTFFAFYSPIFILVYELMLLKPENVINTKKQLAILGGYAVVLCFM